jgi:hypothetical protein
MADMYLLDLKDNKLPIQNKVKEKVSELKE